MKDKPGGKHEVMIDLGDRAVRIEPLPSQEAEPAFIRISAWNKDLSQPGPIDLSEAQLVTLLERAIRAGLLSTEFVHHLRAEFEI